MIHKGMDLNRMVLLFSLLACFWSICDIVRTDDFLYKCIIIELAQVITLRNCHSLLPFQNNKDQYMMVIVNRIMPKLK